MKINIKNKKSIERLLKQGIGYSLFTVSNEKGFEKIAIKKTLFKNKYTLIYFNEDVNAIETKEVKVEISEENTLVIEGYGKVTLQDASFALKNPTEQVARENEIFRQIDRKARDEEITKANVIQSQIIESKDSQIEQIKAEAEKQKDYYTTGRISRLKNLKRNVISTRVNHDSYDYEQRFSLPQGYHMESSSSNYDTTESRGLNFLLDRLTAISKRVESNAFEDNEIATLISKIDEMFSNLNEYDETKLNGIQSLYGLIAEDLTERVYALCDHIRTKEIDTKEFSYSNTLYSSSRPYYEEEHTYTEVEYIDDYFDTVMESVAVFIERVTGQNIREEIKSRLTKYYVTIPVLVKTI